MSLACANEVRPQPLREGFIAQRDALTPALAIRFVVLKMAAFCSGSQVQETEPCERILSRHLLFARIMADGHETNPHSYMISFWQIPRTRFCPRLDQSRATLKTDAEDEPVSRATLQPGLLPNAMELKTNF